MVLFQIFLRFIFFFQIKNFPPGELVIASCSQDRGGVGLFYFVTILQTNRKTTKIAAPSSSHCPFYSCSRYLCSHCHCSSCHFCSCSHLRGIKTGELECMLAMTMAIWKRSSSNLMPGIKLRLLNFEMFLIFSFCMTNIVL